MADILQDYKFAKQGRKPSYPYDEWFDGRIRRLHRETDFDCSAKSIRKLLYEQAKARGKKVSVAVEGDGSVVVGPRGG